MEDYKPIRTIYNGTEYRSRKEARWAVFFDYLGLDVNYESEGYTNDVGINYLPDFSFGDNGNNYIEVKGEMSIRDSMRITEFAENKADSLIVLGNIPKSDSWEVLLDDIYREFDKTRENGMLGSFSIFLHGELQDEPGFFAAGNDDLIHYGAASALESHINEIDMRKTLEAYCKARMAKFEFGETPDPAPTRSQVNMSGKDIEEKEISEILGGLGISISKNSSTSANRIACQKTLNKIYRKCNGDKQIFTEIIDIPLHAFSDRNRFDRRILRALTDFVIKYRGEYDQKILINHLKGSERKPKNAGDFISEIEEYGDQPGRAVLNRYNRSLRDGKRLPDRFPAAKASNIGDQNQSKEVKKADDNMRFIQIMALIKGIPENEFLDDIISKYRAEYGKQYDAILNAINMN